MKNKFKNKKEILKYIKVKLQYLFKHKYSKTTVTQSKSKFLFVSYTIIFIKHKYMLNVNQNHESFVFQKLNDVLKQVDKSFLRKYFYLFFT